METVPTVLPFTFNAETQPNGSQRKKKNKIKQTKEDAMILVSLKKKLDLYRLKKKELYRSEPNGIKLYKYVIIFS